MKIRVFPCDLEGSGCYRVIYPYGLIDANTSHEVVMEARMMDDRMLLPIPPGMVGKPQTAKDDLEVEMFMSSDVYVFQRPMENLYPGVIMKLKVAGKKVVVELDDFMHGGLSPKTAQGLARAKRRSTTEALSLCVRMADLVTVSTEALAEEYRKLNPNVAVIRNSLRYSDFRDIEPSYRKEREQIRVGWMGMMDLRTNDLSLLKPWLNRFLKRHPEVVFVNVGDMKALDYLSIPKARRMHLPGQLFPNHFGPTSEIDIGLVPLARTRFNECKSYLKGMEYGAVGAAVIASETEEYKRWIEDGWNGMLVRRPGTWEDALEDMLTADLWPDIAEANHQKVMDHLIEDHWQDWASLYGKVEEPCLSPS